MRRARQAAFAEEDGWPATEDAGGVALRDQLRKVAGSCASSGIRDVAFDRARGDPEYSGDLPGGAATRRKPRDLYLSMGETSAVVAALARVVVRLALLGRIVLRPHVELYPVSIISDR